MPSCGDHCLGRGGEGHAVERGGGGSGVWVVSLYGGGMRGCSEHFGG
jgi:hypothetical protein